MCGIAGIITQAPTTPEEIASVKAANAALTHRGPDGAGEFQDLNVMLAMRRLSIIDLTGGWQPLYNEDRSLALIANGEIYNFVELRKRLEELGHRFNTNSDCETIVHLYEEYGLDFVQHLRGMFAFALWDARRKRLIQFEVRRGPGGNHHRVAARSTIGARFTPKQTANASSPESGGHLGAAA
jgi:asparagine synthase (glutamine-hydrolysing)